MNKNINPSVYYTPETLRRLGNLAKGIYNLTGDERANPRDYKTNFNDLQRATNIVTGLQNMTSKDIIEGNYPVYGQIQEMPTRNNQHYIFKDGPARNPYYFDGSYVPDLAQFYNLTQPPSYWMGKEDPYQNQARHPLY